MHLDRSQLQAFAAEPLPQEPGPQEYEEATSQLDSRAVIWLCHSGRITHANPAAERLSGYEHQELLSKRVYDLAQGISQENWMRYWQLARLGQLGVCQTLIRHRLGHTVEALVELKYKLIHGKECCCAFIGLKPVLDQTPHLEDMSALLQKASHGLRAPLATSLGLLDLARRQPSRAQDYLAMMESTLRKQDEVIHRLNQIAAPELPLKMEKLRLDAVLAELMNEFVP
ncbi:MAG: PAS domain S-box protein, partial [Cytophagales bacterium]|nr:PAS domain S-box protein [Cytophagales bacterium]